MAKIIIENAVVDRVFTTHSGSHGVAVHETYVPKAGGDARRSPFTLWFDQAPGVEVGQVVSASGFHSVRVREYESNGETRHVADVSVNGTRLIASAPPVESVEPERPADVWGAPTDPVW